MITKPLETERLLLRPAKVSDAEAIYTGWTSDPNVSHFMRWSTHKSIDETIEWLTGLEKELTNPNKTFCDWLFVCKKTNLPIGTGGVYQNKTYNVLELGYGIMKSRWGQGFATEAARGILGYVVSELGATKIYACHAKENLPSGAIIKKLGFVYKSDGKYSKFDGSATFETREYFLEVT